MPKVKLKQMLANTLGFAFVFTAVFGGSVKPIVAQDTNVSKHDDAVRKINLAGRERMITQHLAKSICFASLDVETEMHKSSVMQAHWLFQSTLKHLRDGSPEQKMLPENHPAVLKGLARVSKLWIPFSGAVNSWMLGFDETGESLQQVFELNMPLLKEMNQTVLILEQAYINDAVVTGSTAVAIDVAGRQRMLSQRMSKEFCLIARGYKANENRKNLADSTKLFEQTLKDLISGSGSLGIGTPPPSEIAEQLRRVGKIYRKLQPLLRTAIDGQKPTQEDLAAVAKVNLEVLTEMDKVVYLYEALD